MSFSVAPSTAGVLRPAADGFFGRSSPPPRPTEKGPDTNGPGNPSPSSPASSRSEQSSALNRLLTRYRTDLSQGQPASALGSIAREIATDAKALGQTITLPKAPPSVGNAPAGVDLLDKLV